MQPLLEVFGYPITNTSEEATRHRNLRLCPFNNKVPNCTKDKANDPLGVCSIWHGNETAVTCPVRFREEWLIAEDAAAFFFPPGTKWTSLVEVRLKDAGGDSAGNIDVVLVAYNDAGKITDFGSCEVQAVYISGNVRQPFAHYMEDPEARATMDWHGDHYPRADYLSSSRKRLAPQLLFKGGILQSWGKKQAVAIHRGFFDTLPDLPTVSQDKAELVWLVYDLDHDAKNDRYRLVRDQAVYTKFEPTMLAVTTAEPGNLEEFMDHLQAKLDAKLENGAAPSNATIADRALTEPD